MGFFFFNIVTDFAKLCELLFLTLEIKPFYQDCGNTSATLNMYMTRFHSFIHS